VPHLHPVPRAVLVLGGYGVAYLLSTALLGVPEARAMIGRLVRRGADGPR
jgi:hypothetical protein